LSAWEPEAIPESWLCVDCGFNTAPGTLNRAELEAAIRAAKREQGEKWKVDGVKINHNSEVYTVRSSVWDKAGMEPNGGCLCIGCLEKRLGRPLKPKDFPSDHEFNSLPGTPRLSNRRNRDYQGRFILKHGPYAFEAFASADQSLGTFGTVEEAEQALKWQA
jgi:hypothetical protein